MITDALKLFAKMFLIITVLFTVSLYFVAIFLGPTLFYFTPEGLTASMIQLPALPIWFLTQTIYVPLGLNVGILFLGLWSIFTLSFIVAWKLRESFQNVIKTSIIQPTKKLFNSSLFAMPILNSMTLIIVLITQNLQEAGGIPTGTSPLPGEPFIDFLDLSYAAVAEEIFFRIIPIGAFIAVILLITKRNSHFSITENLKLFFISFLFPDNAKKIAGTKSVYEDGIFQGIRLREWGMLVLTSIIFGLAHFNPGISWEIGKISSATIAGFAIGFSYLLYGAHASIIMHWFFNAYIFVFTLLSEFYPALEPFASAVIFLSIIVGLLGWLTVGSIGIKKLLRKKEKTITIDLNHFELETIS